MSDIKFPKVVVCPPRDTYTNMNFDLVQAENITLDVVTRKAFTEYALDVVQDQFFEKTKNYLEKVQEESRYLNWYYGYTDICFPGILDDNCNENVNYKISTSAVSGSVSTKNFGKFMDDENDTNVMD